MHINEQQHKTVDNTVYYLNGDKWLVREFCKTKKRKDELLKEIEEWKSNQKQLKTT